MMSPVVEFSKILHTKDYKENLSETSTWLYSAYVAGSCDDNDIA